MYQKLLNLDQIKNMPIDNIVQLYKDGYRLEESNNVKSLNSQIVTAQGQGITTSFSISTGALLTIGAGILALIILLRR